MSRTRAERRHRDLTKALRKRRIVREVYHTYESFYWDWYDNLHQYSKNKIHCSCPMCSCKTNNRNRWGESYNPPIGEKRRIEEMEYEVKELAEADSF